jgi:hypothetical protein
MDFHGDAIGQVQCFISEFTSLIRSVKPAKGKIVYLPNKILEAVAAFTVVTMKNAVFCDVTPCGSCKNRCFGGRYRFRHQGDKNQRARNNLSSM